MKQAPLGGARGGSGSRFYPTREIAEKVLARVIAAVALGEAGLPADRHSVPMLADLSGHLDRLISSFMADVVEDPKNGVSVNPCRLIRRAVRQRYRTGGRTPPSTRSPTSSGCTSSSRSLYGAMFACGAALESLAKSARGNLPCSRMPIRGASRSAIPFSRFSSNGSWRVAGSD